MVVLSLCICILSFVACDIEPVEIYEDDMSTAQIDPHKKIYIPVISKGEEHEFWKAVRKGAEQAAEDYDVIISFNGPSTEQDVDDQVELIKLVLAEKPKVLCLAAIDYDVVSAVLNKAVDDGVSIIGFDSGVDSNLSVSAVGTDDYVASMMAADKMAELIDYKGEIAIITHKSVSYKRREGFIDRIEDKYPDIKIVTIDYAYSGIVNATEKTKEILQNNSNIKGIFGTNEGAAIGIVNAVQELNKEGEIVIVGFDAGSLQIDAIKRGVEAGAITQDPVAIGYKTVETAVKIMCGESVDKSIHTPFYWYDKNNIDDEEIQKVLYE